VSPWDPISSIIAEILLTHLENTHPKQMIEINNIIFYTRYIDDILIIYNSNKITPKAIHNYINKIHPKPQFTPTYDHNNSISFLDLLLIRNLPKIEVDIYRKHTTTDTTISFTSNHPTEHKMATYRYLINRMISLPLTTGRRNTK
jgi:hypothetical protein